VPYYFDKIFYELDPENEVEQNCRLSNDKIISWLALRTLSKNSIESFKIEKTY
jgi:hypothetical protein